MPFALTIGVPYELFWHLTPNKLRPFYKSYKQIQKTKDEEMWIMGRYIMSALEATVCNNFLWLGKNGSANKYIEKPFYEQIEEKIKDSLLTQEELDNRELQKMLLAEEMWAKQHKRKGLPETVIL